MVWESVLVSVEEQNKWRVAVDWLASEGEGSELNIANGLIERAPWGTTMWTLTGGNSHSLIGILSLLLSSGWLAERHLDAYAAFVNKSAQEGAGDVWAAGIYLSALLKSNAAKPISDFKALTSLQSFYEEVINAGSNRLFIPANLNNSHWILFQVDLKKKTIVWGVFFTSFIADESGLTNNLGDPMNVNTYGTQFSQAKKGLIKWLSAFWSPGFTAPTRDTTFGRQSDNYSCGVCVLNGMERGIFDAPIFTTETRHQLRIKYFIQLMQMVLDKVRLTFVYWLG